MVGHEILVLALVDGPSCAGKFVGTVFVDVECDVGVGSRGLLFIGSSEKKDP
jgi:hypothetical protein